MRTVMLGSALTLALWPFSLVLAQSLVAAPRVANPLATSQTLALVAFPEAPSAVLPAAAAIVSTASFTLPAESLDRVPAALTPAQKARLALHNLKDPGNLATILGTAAFTIGTNAHTAYGPGGKGFGKNVGVSLLQDATGGFFGTFLIPALTTEDPHYRRMRRASISRRFVHAVSRTVVARHDDGSAMPNYATLLTYPICAEISNLYVPGIHGNGPSTVARIMTGYATDPVNNLITEFLPDVARHIHVQVIFVQRILNQVTSDQYSLP
jgi:hypothetical protein